MIDTRLTRPGTRFREDTIRLTMATTARVPPVPVCHHMTSSSRVTVGQKSLEFTSSLAVLCQVKNGDFDGDKSNPGLNKAQTAPRAGGRTLPSQRQPII